MMLSDLERAALHMLLDEEHAAVVALSAQLLRATVSSREESSSGFVLRFQVAEGAVRVRTTKRRAFIGDVQGEIEGLTNGAGFVLYVEDGYLSMLEGYTFDEPWPQTIGAFKLGYVGGTRKRAYISGIFDGRRA